MKAFGILGMLASAVIASIYLSKAAPAGPTGATGPKTTADVPAYALDVVKQSNASAERRQEAAAEALRDLKF